MFKFPLKIKPLNRLWNSTGPEPQQIWPFTEIVVDKYNPDAHFNDLYEAIQWKNKNYPNQHITIRFGEGEWVLQPSTRLINLSLVGPGQKLATLIFNGDLNVYQPRVPITFRDFSIRANGNATYSVGIFYQGDVSSHTLSCYDLNIQATNGSTGTYGVWLYGGGTIELHNCIVAAYTGGTEWYALLISAGTCRIYGGGEYYGDTGPASVAGTLQLRDLPDIDATAIVGAGTISWEWVRNEYNLISRRVDPSGHLHSKLVASDGSPDPALSANASGNLTIASGLSLRFGSGQAVTAIQTTISNTNSEVPTGAAVYAHTNASANVHGLPANVNVLGNRNAAGQFVQHGTGSSTTAGSAVSVFRASANTTFTFPVAFSSTPRVWVALQDGVTGGAGVSLVSTTGFDSRAWSFSASTTYTIAYLALGS